MARSETTSSASRSATPSPSASTEDAAAPPPIRVLDDAVKSRIAAGEVIERPASVLKELVENALDAGAGSIDITLEGGGRKRLRVADNGHGMDRENLQLSVARHATSKLSAAEELYELSSFGFRGEALPSIASVSKLTVTSRRTHAQEAWKLSVDGGATARIEPAAQAAGTVVDVAELFYNLPARAKFLKGAGPEAAACADMILRLALVRPEVAFTLKQGTQTILSCRAAPGTAAYVRPTGSGPAKSAVVAHSFTEIPPDAFAHRVREALGKTFTEPLVPVAAETAPTSTPGGEPYRLFGLLTPPAHTRPNRSNLYLAVNGRPVRDRTLLSAVTEAYRHLLPPRRFPAGVLYVEAPGSEVDINVHPTKSEVRFKTPGIVYGLLHRAVREAFGAQSSLPAGTDAPAADLRPLLDGASALRPAPPRPGSSIGPASGSSSRPSSRPTSATSPRRLIPPLDLWRARTGPAPSAPSAPAASNEPSASHASHAGEAPAAFRTSPHAAATVQTDDTSAFDSAPLDQTGESSESAASDFRVLGQAGGMYLVVEDAEGLKVIDQHALHERLLFEDFLARARHHRAESQKLLVSESVELSPAQAAAYGDPATAALLADFGFEVEPFGPAAVAVSSLPARLKNLPPAELLREILDAAAELTDPSAGPRGSDGGGGPIDPTELAQRAAYRLACRGALKAGEGLTVVQASALLDEAQQRIGVHCARWTCPHGRPLALAIDWGQLDRHVGRA